MPSRPCRHWHQNVVPRGADGLRSQVCLDCGWEVARLPGLPDPIRTDDELADLAAERRRRLLAGWPLGPLPALRRGR